MKQWLHIRVKDKTRSFRGRENFCSAAPRMTAHGSKMVGI
jgi:hypothetical protein